VKIVELSNHAADQLQKREAERQVRYDKEMQVYEDRLHARQDKIDAGRTNRRAAWERGRYLQATGHALAVVWHRSRRLMESRGKPVKEDPGIADHIWEQGMDGEDALAEYLARTLADEWTLVRGYKNPKGELDAVLVGPPGIYAMEIKHHKGTIHCDKDAFVRDKLDSWGNQVLWHEPICDRGGRSPSRQVNEPADLLERYLRKTMPVRISRCVVFTNEDAELGDVRNLTVDAVFLLSHDDLSGTLRQSTSTLTSVEVERAVRQIERDHRYYQTKRTRRPVPDPASSDLVSAT